MNQLPQTRLLPHIVLKPAEKEYRIALKEIK